MDHFDIDVVDHMDMLDDILKQKKSNFPALLASTGLSIDELKEMSKETAEIVAKELKTTPQFWINLRYNTGS